MNAPSPEVGGQELMARAEAAPQEWLPIGGVRAHGRAGHRMIERGTWRWRWLRLVAVPGGIRSTL